MQWMQLHFFFYQSIEKKWIGITSGFVYSEPFCNYQCINFVKDN